MPVYLYLYVDVDQNIKYYSFISIYNMIYGCYILISPISTIHSILICIVVMGLCLLFALFCGWSILVHLICFILSLYFGRRVFNVGILVLLFEISLILIGYLTFLSSFEVILDISNSRSLFLMFPSHSIFSISFHNSLNFLSLAELAWINGQLFWRLLNWKNLYFLNSLPNALILARPILIFFRADAGIP